MSDRLRILLVDDEEPARERLRSLLGGREGIEIVGEAVDGHEAMERITELAPDAVFLDIQMPGCSGIDVAASLAEPRPRIVFCTAYDDYAVDAFELHAIDYLLKPVNRARLDKTLERLRGSDGGNTIERTAGRFPSRFLAKRGTKFFVVPSSEVLYFVSEGGQTRLETADGHYWMQPTLTELEGRLDPERFFRISRGALVHIDHAREVRPTFGGQGEVLMANEALLPVSRRRFKTLLAALG